MFEVVFQPRALKALTKAERKVQLVINSAVKKLQEGGLNLLDSKRLQGKKYGHRVRLGRWRILLNLFSKEKRIEVVDIFFKKGREDYKKRMKLLK